MLITTSGFGPESQAFVQGKPLELIDGVKRATLLKQYGVTNGGLEADAVLTATDLRAEMPPISPDGKYYWDGSAWQSISAFASGQQ